jgi:arylsulfatase A-like enzyme
MMNKCSIFSVVVAVMYLPTLARGLALAGEAAARPNIILCMADDQGWGDVGYNKHPVLNTPNLDAMADAGLRFDHFYAAAPVCSPTRGSVMTGRHPNRFGCFKWGHTLRPQEITIAEALKRVGYVTGHFGKWHVGPVEKGSPVNPGASGFGEWLSAPNFFDNDPILSREGIAIQTKGESSIVTADAAIAFVRKHVRSRQPFLAVVWFGSPHSPHVAIKEDYAPYAAHGEKKANFYGEIAGIDRAVGKLRTELRDLGIHENTIFWYCSDNGGLPGLGATGGRKHKGSIYEGGLRVPAIIEWPARIPKSRVTKVPANTVDIYPTLVELASARPEVQPPLDGVSLVPLIDGKMTARPTPMGFWDYPIKGIRTPSKQWMSELLEAQKQGREVTDENRLRRDAGKITTQYARDKFPGHSAWLDWPWKLHRIKAQDGAVKMELYHLVDDPGERTDLFAQQQDHAQSMRFDLEKWLMSVVGSLNGDDY